MGNKRCPDEVRKQQAEKQGLVFLHHGKPDYGVYLCSNGHTLEIQFGSVMRGSWECNQCREQYLIQTAAKFGAEYLGESTLGYKYRLIRKKCGCLQDVNIGSFVRWKGGNKCKTCFADKFENKCKEQGIIVEKNLGRESVQVRFLSCGHTKTVVRSHIFKKKVICRYCFDKNIEQEAAVEGLVLNGPPVCENKNMAYRNYTLPCGCTKDIRISHVKNSNWRCNYHSDSHMIRKSYVYLLLMQVSEFEAWLKIGYSFKPNQRFNRYGFTGQVKELKIIEFEFGRDAFDFEQMLHSKYSLSRLCSDEIGNYMDNGKTECYRLHILDSVLKDMEEYEQRTTCTGTS